MVNKCVVVGCDYNYDKRRKRDATGNLLSMSTTDSECNETASSDIQRTGIFHFPKMTNLIKSGLNSSVEKVGDLQITR